MDSSRLWPLLDEAEKAGLQLVYCRKLGALERYQEAELCLDVTRPEADGPLVVTPAIRVDAPGGEETIVPLRFIGTRGHGVVYLDRDEAQRCEDPASWRFRLARLRRGLPVRLQEMALSGRSRWKLWNAESSSISSRYDPSGRVPPSRSWPSGS